jgi:hypothetical protein
LSEQPNPSPKSEELSDPGFAPADLLDGRVVGDWQTRYRGARRYIYLEAAYLLVLMAAAPTFIFLSWKGSVQRELGVAPSNYVVFAKAAYVWLGAMLGGTTFSMKWLYHVVAKGQWNADRRLWRIFTPHLSAATGFAFVALLASNLIGVLDQHTIREPAALLGISFIAGYFSDSTIAALAEFAEQYIGRRRKKPSSE